MKKFFLLISIYLFVWFGLYESKVYNQTDSLWSVYTTISLVREGNLNIDEYSSLFPKTFFANITEIGGHTFNYYPYGVSILAIPHIWIASKWYALKGKDFQEKILSSSTISLEKNISSSLLSISAVLFFLISFHITKSVPKSLLVVFLHSFCTIIFSTVSRGLWQHAGSILLLSILLLFIVLNKKSLFILSALPLFFSYAVRPTNLLPIFFLGLIFIYLLREKSIGFIFLGGLILSFFYLFNYFEMGNLLHPYYDFRKVQGSNTFYEALAGNLISPARGLFIYSPIFLFSFLGIYYKWKEETLSLFDYAIFLTVLFHWVLVSRNLNWWGGHCYGYRLLSDMIPFFVFYLIFFLKYANLKSPIFALFILSIIFSLFINFQGANRMETYYWNLQPSNIDENSFRLWDWKDAPFLR
jgi:hypothetical protein